MVASPHESFGQDKGSLDDDRLINANPASLAQLRDVRTGHLIGATVMKDQIVGNHLDGMSLDPATEYGGEQFCMTQRIDSIHQNSLVRLLVTST